MLKKPNYEFTEASEQKNIHLRELKDSSFKVGSSRDKLSDITEFVKYQEDPAFTSSNQISEQINTENEGYVERMKSGKSKASDYTDFGKYQENLVYDSSKICVSTV